MDDSVLEAGTLCELTASLAHSWWRDAFPNEPFPSEPLGQTLDALCPAEPAYDVAAADALVFSGPATLVPPPKPKRKATVPAEPVERVPEALGRVPEAGGPVPEEVEQMHLS
eukprot:281898-Prymnesium_polylepis.1